MWQILNPEIRKATLDFSSSGQSEVKVSQLYAGDRQLINAIELVGWNMDQDQFLICEACGYVRCQPGNWVSLRSAGSLILIIPAFDSYADGEEANTEYSPPWYVHKLGIPYFNLATYEALQAAHSSFPLVSSIPKLKMREAILAYQGEAPLQVFGRAPKPFAHRGDLIIAASDGEFSEHIRRIEEFARLNAANEASVVLQPLTGTEQIISLYLDTAEFTEWKAVAYAGNELRLILDSKYLIMPESII